MNAQRNDTGGSIPLESPSEAEGPGDGSVATLCDRSVWLPAAVVFLLWLAAFLPVYPELAATWLNHSNNSHGLLVPLISGYLVWRNKKAIAETPIKPWGWGAAVLAAGGFLYIISYAGAIAATARAMIVVTLIGLVLYNFGRQFFARVSFPLVFLFFMVPVPDAIYSLAAFPLQCFATDVSSLMIRALSIPVYQEGNMLYFANAQLEVAESCSGLRSMVSFVMLGFLFAHTMKPRVWRHKSLMVLSAVPLAIFANIVRVTGTGILAHYFGARVARGYLHEFSGLVVFAFGLVFLLGVYRILTSSYRREVDICT